MEAVEERARFSWTEGFEAEDLQPFFERRRVLVFSYYPKKGARILVLERTFVYYYKFS